MGNALDGKVALVTGASRGIGRAVALRLAKGGAFTYINYVSREEAARETLAIAVGQGGQGALSCFDVRDEEAVRTACAKIIKDHGRIDILVNNAGVWRGGPALRVTREAWD
ncbi:MAG: SDR family NAD(P)-dependent oxidoreductase, partial [Syntrophales bacterium]|nr:SDR family NAD(P)-dependent oxidoreductase [Syntrophales bacterium]